MENTSTEYSEAFKKFADWIESNEKRVRDACSCPTESNLQKHAHLKSGKDVINYHSDLQNEIEVVGNQLLRELQHQPKPEGKSETDKQWKEIRQLEERWHKLYLIHLEQLVIVEKNRRCPIHNITMIGKPIHPPGVNRLVQAHRRRPISYPNNQGDRLEWDYAPHTLKLTGCHTSNGSQLDLESVDEQQTRNLIEFGENYELWMANEDEVPGPAMHSRPQSVEPPEKPEIARAVETSNSATNNINTLTVTKPSSMYAVEVNHHSHGFCSRLWHFAIMAVLFGTLIGVLFPALQDPHLIHRSYRDAQPPI